MKHLRFTFDVISPYAYLAFERLPQVLGRAPVSRAGKALLAKRAAAAEAKA